MNSLLDFFSGLCSLLHIVQKPLKVRESVESYLISIHSYVYVCPTLCGVSHDSSLYLSGIDKSDKVHLKIVQGCSLTFSMAPLQI